MRKRNYLHEKGIVHTKDKFSLGFHTNMAAVWLFTDYGVPAKTPLSLQTKTQSSPICSAKTNQDLHFAKISGKGLGSFQGR